MSRIRVVFDLDDAIIKNGRISVPIVSESGGLTTDFIVWDAVWLSRLSGVKVTVENAPEVEPEKDNDFSISLENLKDLKGLYDEFINFVEKLNGGRSGTRVD